MQKPNQLSFTLPKTNFFDRLCFVLVFALVLVLPLFYVVCSLIQEYFPIITSSYNEYMLMIIVITAGVFFICFSLSNLGQGMSMVKWCIFLYLAAVFIRCFAVLLINGEPISDFGVAYSVAANTSVHFTDMELQIFGNDLTEYLAKHIHYGSYSLVLKVWFLLFPPSFISAGVMNAIIVSFIPPILTIGVTKILGLKIGLLTGFFYAFFPGVIVYTVVCTGEHLAQLFLALIFTSFVYVLSCEEKDLIRRIFLTVLIVSVGLLNIFKPILVLVIFTLLIVYFLFFFVPIIWGWIVEKKITMQPLLVRGCELFVVVLLSMTLSRIASYGVRMILNDTAVPGSRNYAQIAFEGLSSEGGGQWNYYVKEKSKQIAETSTDSTEATATYLELLEQDYRNNGDALLNLLHSKVNESWSNARVFYYWTNSQTLDTSNPIIYNIFCVSPDFYYGLLNLLGVFGLLTSIYYTIKQKHDQVVRALFFVAFFYLINFFTFLILEAQGRYKSYLMPMLCILAAVGAKGIKDGVVVLKNKFIHMLKMKKSQIEGQANTGSACAGGKQ